MFHLMKQTVATEAPEIRTLYDLKRHKQWACHDSVEVPISPINGRPASCQDSQSWGTYEQARQHWLKHRPQVVGVGFMLTPDLGITVIELNNCIINGQLNNFAHEIVEILDAYTEISPDGNGLHIWVPTNLATHAKDNSETETRYIPITGKVWREE